MEEQAQHGMEKTNHIKNDVWMWCFAHLCVRVPSHCLLGKSQQASSMPLMHTD